MQIGVVLLESVLLILLTICVMHEHDVLILSLLTNVMQHHLVLMCCMLENHSEILKFTIPLMKVQNKLFLSEVLFFIQKPWSLFLRF